MDNPSVWNERDLLEKIANGWKESIDLDFKRSDALQNTDGKKNEISKDVSAFANSAGGTIIYGIIEDGYVKVAHFVKTEKLAKLRATFLLLRYL